MHKRVAIAFLLAFATTSTVSILWHAVLFSSEFRALGVFTRMDEPIYGYGITAWVLEAFVFVAFVFVVLFATLRGREKD
ncbi:MAG: hypothetical protein AAGF12_20025 [Myxococcota bacterium]